MTGVYTSVTEISEAEGINKTYISGVLQPALWRGILSSGSLGQDEPGA